MTDSILTSIKKMLGGIEESDTYFDPDIIMHINSVIFILNQSGVGPSTGFRIEDATAKWSDFVPATANLESIKSFMHLRVKLLFDPPQNSFPIGLMEKQAEEFLWRITNLIE